MDFEKNNTHRNTCDDLKEWKTADAESIQVVRRREIWTHRFSARIKLVRSTPKTRLRRFISGRQSLGTLMEHRLWAWRKGKMNQNVNWHNESLILQISLCDGTCQHEVYTSITSCSNPEQWGFNQCGSRISTIPWRSLRTVPKPF